MTYKTIKMCCFIILSRSEIVELPECTIQTQYNENKLEWVYLLILVKDSDTFLTHNENITDLIHFQFSCTKKRVISLYGSSLLR